MKPLALLSLIPAIALAAPTAHETLVTKRNAANTDYATNVILDPGANSLMYWNEATNLWTFITVPLLDDALGLGTAAYTPATDYATAAQGALADTAIQPGDGGAGDPGHIYAVDYGVVVNDATEDTDELQAAIDAASALAALESRRVTVVLPAGLILVRKSAQPAHIGLIRTYDKHCIRMRANVNIVGAGKGTTEVRAMDTLVEDRPIFLAVEEDSDNITLSHFTINGRATERALTGGAEDEAVDPYYYENFEAHNMRIINTGQDGFDLDFGENARIVDCDFYRVGGDAIHTTSTTTGGIIVSGCFFEAGGILRNNIYPDQGAAIGMTETKAMTVTNCRFKDNVREIHSINSEAIFDSCVIEHNIHPDGGILELTEPAVEIDPASSQTIRLSDCTIIHKDSPGIEDRSATGILTVNNCRITASYAGDMTNILVTNGGRVTVRNSEFSGWRSIDIVATASPAIITGNHFQAVGTHSIRVYNSANGMVSGNKFAAGVTALALHSESSQADGWQFLGNYVVSTLTAVDAYGGNGTRIVGNTGFAAYSFSTSDHILQGNQIGNLTFVNGSTTGVVIRDNIITGTISHTTVTYASNTWINNSGVSVDSIFRGVATLVGGTVTVNTAAVGANSRIILSRQTVGGTVGELSVGTRVANTSFAIDSNSGTDTSVVFWSIDR